MKRIFTKLILVAFLAMTLQGCFKEPRNDTSIIPGTFNGRYTQVLGDMYINSTNITISVFDHGLIDGDIVSIYVNGDLVIDNRELDGPNNKIVANVNLEYTGYNYVLLYAHNEGSISPNTCTLEIDDGDQINDYVLEADLLTNGAVNVIVN